MKIIAAIAFLLCPLMAWAVEYPDLVKYYPLAAGNKWVYDAGLGVVEVKVDSVDLSNNSFMMSKVNSMGRYNYSIKRSGNKIIKVSHINKSNGKIVYDRNSKILVAPFKKGKSWTNYVDGNYSETYKFVGFVEKDVKAGSFKNVAKFEIIQRKRKKIESTNFEYYAPNVGLIKTEIKSKNTIAPLMELNNYTINVPSAAEK
jgi:hypothetical protein